MGTFTDVLLELDALIVYAELAASDMIGVPVERLIGEANLLADRVRTDRIITPLVAGE